MKRIAENWYWYIAVAFLVFIALVYIIVGENSYIAVHDNLDLFLAQYKMLKDNGAFFSHGVKIPYLGGITRDDLPSEFALSTVLYMVLPMFAAYVVNYLLKIVIAVIAFYLLAKELCGGASFDQKTSGKKALGKETSGRETSGRETSDQEAHGMKSDFWKPLAVLCGLAFGLLNVFPAFGIPFASIPLAVWLLLKIDRATDIKKACPWYVALFAYPFVSYFSYFGLFLCGYLVIAFLWVSIARKKVDRRLLLAIPVLALGYVAFEYRLFSSMLLSDEVTIRSTMAGTDFTFAQVISEAKDVFVHSIFHAESLQYKWILPLTLLYFVIHNARYVARRQAGKIFHDLFNLIMLLLVCNALIYGLYDYAPMRGVVEFVCPPLQGWQFNRTLFFNPFLWYAALFVMLWQISMAFDQTLVRVASIGIVGVAILIILFSDTRYNDLFHTGYNTALKVVKHKEPDIMNYREFYGEKLFEQALSELGYQGEWSVAYGFHPAVLEYNGIATLDGYLGFYAQSYKEAFREVIAPALERVEASRIYYDDWGARAYVYAGTDLTAVSEYKSFTLSDYRLYMDANAFHRLGGTYIFSRYPLEGIDALRLEKAGEYEDASVPYKLYVYK